MAKGQISEQDLKAGIQSLGGFGGLAATGPRRDSPFGSDLAKHMPRVAPEVAVGPATFDTKTPESMKETEGRGVGEPPSPGMKAPSPSKPLKQVPRGVSEAMPARGTRDSSLEPVTVPMAPELRDDANFLARRLQRRRTTKEERITANTVMRVAIQFVIDELKLGETDVANTEAEFLALVRRKILEQS